ncbi:alpha-ketoglutarate-dependent dioxygenase AlkB [Sphingomonas sp. HDW15A]|nr:alpha-ketoglutarate-dependent dioxygenase AlkB [Sphingomonas sp. HDW15A]
MRDLFGTAPVAGLVLREDVVSEAEEGHLVHRCQALDLSPFQFQGWEGKRLTKSYGWHYDFDRGRIGETEPIPDWLLTAREKAANALGRDPVAFLQALVIRYDPGAGIGWHRDRPQFDEVIGVTLASDATLAFRRRREDGKFDRTKQPLHRRSAYLLSGEARAEWQHGIAEHEALRFSLTFRSLR